MSLGSNEVTRVNATNGWPLSDLVPGVLRGLIPEMRSNHVGPFRTIGREVSSFTCDIWKFALV